MTSLMDALQKAGAQGLVTTKAYTRPEAFELQLDESGNFITVTALNPESLLRRFASFETFFLELRRKVRELLNDQGWNIRYASQVPGINLPFLHHGPQRMIFIDMMLPYRNPLRDLAAGGELLLYRLPSQVYYAKPKDEAFADASKPDGNNEARRSDPAASESP